MKLEEAIKRFKAQEDLPRRKRVGFTNLLTEIEKKNFSEEVQTAIENELEVFRGSDIDARTLKKQMKVFRNFLMKELKMQPGNYYSSLGTGLGLALGTSLGISVGTAFGLPLGPIFGLTIGSALGLVAGILIGKKYDQKAEKENRVLDHL